MQNQAFITESGFAMIFITTAEFALSISHRQLFIYTLYSVVAHSLICMNLRFSVVCQEDTFP